MRTHIIALLGILTLPIATAGITADAAFLDQSRACESSYDQTNHGSSDGESWWYSSYSRADSRCHEQYEFAGAAAQRDGRNVAAASVASERGNETRSESGSWGNGGASYASWSSYARDQRTDTDARSARIETIEGNAAARSGCDTSRDSTRGDGSWSSWREESSSYWSGRSANDREVSDCGMTVTAHHAGEDVAVGHGTRCERQGGHSEGYRSDGAFSGGDRGSSASGACQEGPRATALGEDVRAGRESGCASSQGEWWGSGPDGSYYTGSQRGSACHDAQAIHVGDELTLWIGATSWQRESCSGVEPQCYGESGSFNGVVLSARHLGTVVQPLP